MDDIILANYVITCHTDNCGNGGQLISIQAPDVDPNFICGVCSQPISNVTKLDTPPNSVA